MNKVEYLLDLLDRAFYSSRWHSLMLALEGVSDEVFFWKPEKHSGFRWMDGSIRDIVYHIAGDNLVQCSHAFEDGSVRWDSLDLDRDNQQALLEVLEQSHLVVVNQLKSLRDEALDGEVMIWEAKPKPMRCEDLFIMLVEHYYYHAGQIRLIRNLVEDD